MLSRLFAALAPCALLCAALAQDAPPPQGPDAPPAPGEEQTILLDPSQIQGERWSGEVSLPGGQRLQFVAKLQIGEEGNGSGRLDVPMQGMTNQPLSDVFRDDEVIRFALKPQGTVEQGWALFDLKMEPGGTSARGTMRQFGQEFPCRLELMKPGDEEGPRRPQNPTPPFPYTERELTFTNAKDGTVLVGTLTIPGKPPAGELVDTVEHPAVLLISGSGAQDRDSTIMGHKPFLVLADRLARAGIASFRFDDRGVGGSQGDAMQSTMLDFVDDARAAVQMMKLQADIDPMRVIVVGHSEGAMVAAELAADSQEVAGAVLLAGPAVPGGELLTRQAEAIMKASGVDEKFIAESSKWQGVLVERVQADAPEDEQLDAMRKMIEAQFRAASAVAGQPNPEIDEKQVDELARAQLEQLRTPWFRFFLLYDPRVALRKLRVPVLVLNGERDLQVAPDQNLPEMRKALAAAQNPDATVKMVADVNHLFQTVTGENNIRYGDLEETFSPAAMVQIEVWLRRQFGM